MQLADICEIRSGYTARGKLETATEGGAPAIQLSDIDSGGEIDWQALQRYQLADLRERYLVHGGDVVFRSRGQHNTAVVVDRSVDRAIAVILPLVIMRPDERILSAEYLAWAINQPEAQRRLGAGAQGTSLRMVPISVLALLEITVPDLETQRRIVAVDALARREARLLRDLADRREQLAGLLLNEAAQRAA